MLSLLKGMNITLIASLGGDNAHQIRSDPLSTDDRATRSALCESAVRLGPVRAIPVTLQVALNKHGLRWFPGCG